MSNSLQDLTNRGPLRRLARWWCGRIKAAGNDMPAGHRRRKDLVKYAYETAAAAEASGDPEKMYGCTYLIRLELYERAWTLRLRAAALTEQSSLPEWDGSDLADRTILIRAYNPRNRAGEELRMARFIAPLAKQGRRCLVLAEPRLVPILARSFPGIDVRPRGVDDSAAYAEADIAAYYETIALRFVKTGKDVSRAFVPLQADPARVAALRQRYKLDASGPLVGISWGSSNERKVLPPLESWAPLLDWPRATFVTLQYGNVERDLALLRGFGGRVIQDTEIDQIVDLDAFAAQIAALDAVVSISNTTIDMAGMLHVPTLHIRGDKPSAIWPSTGPSPWYPDMVFLYRQSRPWPGVFAEAKARLKSMLATEC